MGTRVQSLSVSTSAPSRSKSGGESSWQSLKDNASKAFQPSASKALQPGDAPLESDDLGADDARSRQACTRNAPLVQTGIKYWRKQFRQWSARVAYQYYNWRSAACALR